MTIKARTVNDRKAWTCCTGTTTEETPAYKYIANDCRLHCSRVDWLRFHTRWGEMDAAVVCIMSVCRMLTRYDKPSSRLLYRITYVVCIRYNSRPKGHWGQRLYAPNPNRVDRVVGCIGVARNLSWGGGPHQLEGLLGSTAGAVLGKNIGGLAPHHLGGNNS